MNLQQNIQNILTIEKVKKKYHNKNLKKNQFKEEKMPYRRYMIKNNTKNTKIRFKK